MTPFTTIEEAFEYAKSQPLTADKFEIAMSDGYTYEGRPDRPTGKFTLGMAFLVMHLLRYDLEPTDSEHLDGFTVFRFSRIRMTSAADVPFPDDFKPQRVRLKKTPCWRLAKGRRQKSSRILSCIPRMQPISFFVQEWAEINVTCLRPLLRRYIADIELAGCRRHECMPYRLLKLARMRSPTICFSRSVEAGGTGIRGLHNQPTMNPAVGQA